MKVVPIPMTADSVRKIRDHLKTESRRVIVPQPVYNPLAGCTMTWEWKGKRYTESEMMNRCPFRIGDLLWVREPLVRGSLSTREILYESDGAMVRAFSKEPLIWQWKRKSLPSRFMPRYACRTYLRLTNRRIEALRGISNDAIIREGFPSGDILEFKTIWNAINQRRGYGWSADPWVWVLNFFWEEHLEEELEVLRAKGIYRNYRKSGDSVSFRRIGDSNSPNGPTGSSE